MALLLLGSAFFFSSRADIVDLIEDPEFPTTFNVKVLIEGHNEVFLVDTGATTSAISRRLLGKLISSGDAVPIERRVIELADGSLLIVFSYMITAMTIGDCELETVAVLVFQGKSSNILGISELRRLGRVAFDAKKNKMVFECPM